MSFVAFVRDNRPWLAAGLVLTFSSSFGQTWFIALFAAEIRAELGLSDGAWGALYSLGTTASATVLILAGGLADRFRARALALAVLAAFAVACVAMARVDSVAMLGVVIFALRFCGQGMMSQIAMTAMARWFRAQRGRAVAVAGLGYSLGESIMPTLAVALAGLVGWRNTWLAAAGLLLLLAPLLLRLLAGERTPRDWAETSESLGLGGRHWTRAEALRHWMFWPVTVGVLGPPLIGTAIFFQQARIAEAKDLGLGAVAGAYPVYAAVTIMASFATGWVVDRVSARVMLPFYQVPMAGACLVLAFTAGPWTVPLAFALCGLTQGGAVALLGALWPELYGTRHVGAIRGTAVSTMVFATALGPGLTGGLLDLGIGIEAQFAGLAVVQAGLCLMLGRVALEALRRRAAGG
jgi:MFS family permease